MKTVIQTAPGLQTVVALEDGNLITGTIQEIDPFIEYVAALKAAGITGTSEMKFAGTIPEGVVEKYCNSRGITFEEFMHNPIHTRLLLNDSDYKKLRVWEGRL